MSAARLLERLDRVTQHGADRWRACCPGHESRNKTQSLSIRELGDGTLLIKCFAGCGIDAICASLGIEIRDLFPGDHRAPGEPRHPQKARHWHAVKQAVQALHFECLVVAMAADDIAAGKPLSPPDAERVALAAGRVRAAVEACQ